LIVFTARKFYRARNAAIFSACRPIATNKLMWPFGSMSLPPSTDSPASAIFLHRLLDDRLIENEIIRRIKTALAAFYKIVILTVKRDLDGKMRATARNWPDGKVICRDEVIELRNVDGQIRVARKIRHHDEWDPPIEPYVPMGGVIQGRLCDGSRC
jgi:hypothetical protein